MLEKQNFGKTCLIVLAALTVSSFIPDAAAQAIPVTYAANENAKTIQIPIGQTPGRVDIDLRSAPIARVCGLGDGNATVRAFVVANPLRATAIVQLRLLRQLNIPNDVQVNPAWEEGIRLLAVGGRTPHFVASGGVNPMGIVTLSSLPVGISETRTLRSDCLTIPNFNSWKAELVRILDRYYGLVAPY